MYIYGKEIIDFNVSADSVEQIIVQGRNDKLETFSQYSMADILDVLDKLSQLWAPDGSYYKKAFDLLLREIPFSPEMIKQTLDLIPWLMKREVLEKRLKSEFTNSEVLDNFVHYGNFEAKVFAVPRGILFHVSAGNVFLGTIDSLLMGFLTKNISIVKLSSQNKLFPLLFAKSIKDIDKNNILADKFSFIYFRRGEKEIENLIKTSVDTIIAWGGDEMIKVYKNDLAPGIKLLEYGPKISFQVISKKAVVQGNLQGIAEKIAADVCRWDQAACASPQNLFFEDGIDEKALLDAIAEAMEKYPISRGNLSADEHVELLKEMAKAKASHVLDGGLYLQGNNFILHMERQKGLRPSALNRTLILKKYDDLKDLIKQLKPFSSVLQSCSYLLTESEKAQVLPVLAKSGIQRFAPLGTIMEGMVGAPHDGRFGLNELIRFVPDESSENFLSFINETIEYVPYYRKLMNGQKIGDIKEVPLLTSELLADNSLIKTKNFLREDAKDGYIFSSGGTTGKPKYAFYTHEEFRLVGKLLAKGIASRGLTKGDVVANLFVSGNMWSSFLAIEKALTEVGAIELPIGGNASLDTIINYLDKFKPKAVFAIPTLLIELMKLSINLKINLNIPMVFYAGEHLSGVARKELAKVWKTKVFASAGYASVDAGPIGYQCSYCEDSIHHLFSDFIHLEVISGEGVVTSMLRKSMPIIRYKTGDRIEFVEDRICPCGNSDKLFRLLGRLDSQINIWGCRVLLQDIEQALCETNVAAPVFQVQLNSDQEINEFMTIAIETDQKLEQNKLYETIYRLSKDLKASVDLEFLKTHLKFNILKDGAISRIQRTGKIVKIIDERM